MNDDTFGYYYSSDYVDDPFIPSGENIILERNNTIRNYLQPYYKRQLGIIK